MRRAPTRRSDDHTPHRDAVQRPAQQPVKKQPSRPMPTPTKKAGVPASRNASTGRSSASIAMTAAIGAPTIEPSIDQPSLTDLRHCRGRRMTYQSFAPTVPPMTATAATISAGPAAIPSNERNHSSARIPTTIPRTTIAVQLPWMTAGIAVRRTNGPQRVWTGAKASSCSRQRSHDQRTRGSVCPPRTAVAFVGIGRSADELGGDRPVAGIQAVDAGRHRIRTAAGHHALDALLDRERVARLRLARDRLAAPAVADRRGERRPVLPRIEPMRDGQPLVPGIGGELGLRAGGLHGVGRRPDLCAPARLPVPTARAHRGCSVMRRP